ncbi:hypothetical protein GQ53DRAFT_849761 [Thozetella sp. PMI_491]|nr:hypothetical protein GQ53DRAFT_849761 [Thozetella sp. PMI_491]
MTKRRLPYLDLAMDGLVSKGPSSGSRTPTTAHAATPSSGQSFFGLDPPRPAKDSYEWVWFPEGYWAERELRKPGSENQGGRVHPEVKTWRWRARSAKSQSAPDFEPRGISPKTMFYAVASSTSQSPSQVPQSPFLSEEAHVHSLQHPAASSGVASPESEWLAPKHRLRYPMSEGGGQIAVKRDDNTSTTKQAKKGIRRNKVKEKRQSIRDESVGATLDAVKRYFDLGPATRASVLGEDKDNERSTTKVGRKLFGKAPWHRKSSVDSGRSASSSVRDILKGRTPPVTPDLEPTKTHDTVSKKLFATSEFPGGEASRVLTPPLKKEVTDRRLRSFFPDVSTGNSGSGSWSVSLPRTKPSANRHRKTLSPRPTEWWELPKSAIRRDPMSMFEFDIPEHLPNSPMCPANPSHKSKGKGICVYHGRGGVRFRQTSVMSPARPTDEDARS